VDQNAAEGRTRLLVVLAANIFGGAEVQTHSLLTGLCRQFDVTLITHARIAGRFRDLPLTLVEFESFGLAAPYHYGWRNVLAYGRAIAAIAKQSAASLVYAVMHNSSLFAAAARWFHPLLMRKRAVTGSLHGSFAGCFEQRGSPATLTEAAAIRAVVKTMDAIVTPSQGVANELVETFGARADRTHAIYNGFDLDAIRKAAQDPLPVEKTGNWVLTCCRLSDQKDFRTLIEAFARASLPESTRLVILGEGPERNTIESLIREHGLGSRVLLPGFQSNPFPWIRSAEIFVLSSFFEGFGNVIVEAFALSIPAVASDCPWGPAEIIEHGVSGYLFPMRDSACLAQYLGHLFADESLRRRMGEAALQRSGEFSVQRMGTQYKQLLDAICTF
jgi:glycosyltransferase involved in cell wall biosynthesis